MAHRHLRLLSVVILVPALLILASCKSAPTVEPPVAAPPAFESAPAPAEKVEETTGFQEAAPSEQPVAEPLSSQADRLNAQGILKMIHFDFDRYDLRPDAIRTLDENAAQLRAHARFKVRIEGHCDERGTVEYNLALGERRARAARDYLVSKGVPAAQLRIISYGKERPRDSGHNEEAWATNRRDEFIFLAD